VQLIHSQTSRSIQFLVTSQASICLSHYIQDLQYLKDWARLTHKKSNYHRHDNRNKIQ